MLSGLGVCVAYFVALYAEGVGRNYQMIKKEPELGESPSTRRAWVEIIIISKIMPTVICRPLRGGRG